MSPASVEAALTIGLSAFPGVIWRNAWIISTGGSASAGSNNLHVMVAPEGRRLRAPPTASVLDNLPADHVSGDCFRPSIANFPPDVVRLWDV